MQTVRVGYPRDSRCVRAAVGVAAFPAGVGCCCSKTNVTVCVLWLLGGAPASLIATLVVFRNNISHARFNEARSHASVAKNALRTVCGIVLSGGHNVSDTVRYEQYKREAREITRQLQVGPRGSVVWYRNALSLIVARFCSARL